MSANEFSRRLLSIDDLAQKLSMSKSAFYRHKPSLERRGFPPPLLAGGKGFTTRWDERAVDLWLDSQMDPALRAAAPMAAAIKQAANAYELAATLQSRARNLSL